MKTNIFQKSVAAAQATIQNNGHHLFSFYQKNMQHMNKVMLGFEKSAATAQQAAKSVSILLKKDKLPTKKYFGTDAMFIRAFTWLGVTGLLKGQFTAR
jgi:hypothetical protein